MFFVLKEELDENQNVEGCSQEEGEDEATGFRAEGDAEVPPHQGGASIFLFRSARTSWITFVS